MEKHVISVHLRLRPYACDMCDKKFGEKSNLTKQFAFRDGLMRHVRLVHMNERNFDCDVPGCSSFPFKQASHLKKHKISVHKIPTLPALPRHMRELNKP
eukprot:IDg17718t1